MGCLKHLKVGAIVTAVAMVIMIPVELIHAVLWIVKHLYMLFEHMLSILIIEIFETSRRTTDYVVGYTVIIMGIFLTFKAFILVKTQSQKLFKVLPAWSEQNTTDEGNGFSRSPKLHPIKLFLGISAGMTLIAMTSF